MLKLMVLIMVYQRIYKTPRDITKRTNTDGFLIKRAAFCMVIKRLFIHFDVVAISIKVICLTYPSLYLRAFRKKKLSTFKIRASFLNSSLQL
jgi:hypothetical protein